MRARQIKIFATFAIGLTPVALLANGMRLGSQDGFATARGEAFVATADNPSAVYYNPAGLTQLEGSQARSGIYGIYLDPAFTPPAGAPNAGQTYHIHDQLAAVPQFFLSQSFPDSKLSFGLGVYSPYGANVSWPQDTGFRAVATDAAIKYFRFNPVIALNIDNQVVATPSQDSSAAPSKSPAAIWQARS